MRVGTAVTLDGSGSTDPDGTTVVYSWRLTAKPPGSRATLNNPTSATPNFTADRSGTYKFSLTVNDGTVTSGVAHVAITATTGNVVPVANAGNDQIAGVGAVFTLDGSGSADPNGDTITSYSWRFQSVPIGSNATLANGNTVNPTFIPDRVGFYVLTLSVNDGHANSPLDTVVITGSEAIGGSGTVQPSGGTITTDLGEVTIPPNTALQAVRVTVTPVPPPAGLPAGLTPLGAATDITVTPPDVLNAPLLIKLKYSDSNVVNENAMAVAHYNAHFNKYEPVTFLAQDTVANTITIESRAFSAFVIFTYVPELSPVSYNVGFSPATNGWNINNFGTSFSKGGQCLGMAGYATWFFANKSEQLYGKFPAVGTPPGTQNSIAHLVAARAQLAQSQYWADINLRSQTLLGTSKTGALMKMYLSYFNQPLIILFSENVDGSNGSHASVVYAYDATGFWIYDVRFMNAVQHLSFDGSSWGAYDSFKSFGFVAIPSLGRSEDFAVLTAQAEGGFASSNLISVTAPTEGQQLQNITTPLVGTLSGELNSLVFLIASVNGSKQGVPVSSGSFSYSLGIAPGDNYLILMAGVDLTKQNDWYPNAATLVRTFKNTTNPFNGVWVGTRTFSCSPYAETHPNGIDISYSVTDNVAFGRLSFVLFGDHSLPGGICSNCVGALATSSGNVASITGTDITFTVNGGTMIGTGFSVCSTETLTRSN